MTNIHPEGSIDLEVREGVLLIGINRPHKRNGFTPKMYREFISVQKTLSNSEDAKEGVQSFIEKRDARFTGK